MWSSTAYQAHIIWNERISVVVHHLEARVSCLFQNNIAFSGCYKLGFDILLGSTHSNKCETDKPKRIRQAAWNERKLIYLTSTSRSERVFRISSMIGTYEAAQTHNQQQGLNGAALPTTSTHFATSPCWHCSYSWFASWYASLSPLSTFVVNKQPLVFVARLISFVTPRISFSSCHTQTEHMCKWLEAPFWLSWNVSRELHCTQVLRMQIHCCRAADNQIKYVNSTAIDLRMLFVNVRFNSLTLFVELSQLSAVLCSTQSSVKFNQSSLSSRPTDSLRKCAAPPSWGWWSSQPDLLNDHNLELPPARTFTLALLPQ